MKKNRFIGLLVAAILSVGSILHADSSIRNMRVLIVSGQREVVLKRDDFVVTLANGKKYKFVDPVDAHVTVDGSGLVLNNFAIGSDFMKVESQTGYIYIGGKPYKGIVEVHLVKGALTVVNDIDIEAYLMGIINHEISSKWHPEVLKAQAVAARSYAYDRKIHPASKLYDIRSSYLDQVYGGAVKEDASAQTAVRETEGEVLTMIDGRVLAALFHSSCGGTSTLPEYVWGTRPSRYYAIESDDVCRGTQLWQIKLTREQIANAFGRHGMRASSSGISLAVIGHEPSGRVSKVRISSMNGAFTVTGNTLRKMLGYDKLKSTMFTISSSDSFITITGNGSGHGVGLCQWGAKARAERGEKYRDILNHYYKNVEIKKLW